MPLNRRHKELCRWTEDTKSYAAEPKTQRFRGQNLCVFTPWGITSCLCVFVFDCIQRVVKYRYIHVRRKLSTRKIFENNLHTYTNGVYILMLWGLDNVGCLHKWKHSAISRFLFNISTNFRAQTTPLDVVQHHTTRQNELFHAGNNLFRKGNKKFREGNVKRFYLVFNDLVLRMHYFTQKKTQFM